MFIDNPTKPTVFRRDNYADYLRENDFTPD